MDPRLTCRVDSLEVAGEPETDSGYAGSQPDWTATLRRGHGASPAGGGCADDRGYPTGYPGLQRRRQPDLDLAVHSHRDQASPPGLPTAAYVPRDHRGLGLLAQPSAHPLIGGI